MLFLTTKQTENCSGPSTQARTLQSAVSILHLNGDTAPFSKGKTPGATRVHWFLCFPSPPRGSHPCSKGWASEYSGIILATPEERPCIDISALTTPVYRTWPPFKGLSRDQGAMLVITAVLGLISTTYCGRVLFFTLHKDTACSSDQPPFGPCTLLHCTDTRDPPPFVAGFYL